MGIQRVLSALRAALPYLALLLALLGMGNFFWFIGEDLHFGGGALNGFVRDGHYYLAQHGSYTEVSRAIWEHLRLHELSVWLSWPLVLVCLLYWMISSAFPQKMGLREGEAVAARVRAVQASGMPLASGRCGGNIGGVGLMRPFFGVEVFPGGITIRLALQQPVAILKAELIGVEKPKWRYGRTQITHRSHDVSPSVVLFLSPSSELAWALNLLVARATVGATAPPQGG